MLARRTRCGLVLAALIVRRLIIMAVIGVAIMIAV